MSKNPASKRRRSRNSITNSDGVDEPPMDQWSHTARFTGPPFTYGDIYEHPRKPSILKVVALISNNASEEMINKGYTCRGCGSSSNRLVAGTLNKGGRLAPHCLACFGDARGDSGDTGPEHDLNNFHVSPWLHAHRSLVEEITGIVALAPIWMPRRVNIKHQLRKVGSMGLQTVRPARAGGCVQANCSGCLNVNSLLEVWLPEVTPWYGKSINTVVIHSQQSAAMVIQKLYRHHTHQLSVMALLAKLTIFVAKVHENIEKWSNDTDVLAKLERYQDLVMERLQEQAMRDNTLEMESEIKCVLISVHVGRVLFKMGRPSGI